MFASSVPRNAVISLSLFFFSLAAVKRMLNCERAAEEIRVVKLLNAAFQRTILERIRYIPAIGSLHRAVSLENLDGNAIDLPRSGCEREIFKSFFEQGGRECAVKERREKFRKASLSSRSPRVRRPISRAVAGGN